MATLRAWPFLLLATGCLSAPVRPGGADGGLDPDAAPPGPFTCPEDGGAPRSWPPGTTLTLRDLLVSDLDRDGFDDLLVSDVTDGSEAVYVLRGRAQGFGTLYDGVVETAPFRPYRMHVADVGGTEAPDLLLVGDAENGSSQVYLHAYEGVCASVYDDTPRYRLLNASSLAVTSNPFLITTANLDGDAIPDLVAGDIYKLFTMELSTWDRTAFSSIELFQVQSPSADYNWTDAVTARAVPSAMMPDRDDLVIARDPGAAWLRAEGGLSFQDPPVVVQGGGTMRLHAFWPLDDDDADDVVGSSTDQGIYVALLRRSLLLQLSSGPLQVMDSEIDGVAVHDFDGNGQPELLILDQAPGALSGVVMVPDVHLDDPSAPLAFESTTSVDRVGFESFHPGLFAVGNFVGDDRAEIVVVHRNTGEIRCVRYESGIPPTLVEGCP